LKHTFYILFLISLSVFGQKKENDQTSFDDNFFEAMTERLKENYQQSNELFEKCLLIDDKNDVIYFKIAQNYFDVKDYEQSLLYLQKAQKINPKNKWYQKQFIEIKIKQGADTKAVVKMIKEFEPVAKNKYIIQDLYRKMYAANRKPVSKPKVTYTTPSKQNQLATLWQQKAYQKILNITEKILDEQPENAEAYLYKAKAYTDLKKYNEALDYLDMGMDFVSDNKKMQKAFYATYISIYKALNNPGKVKFYQEKYDKI